MDRSHAIGRCVLVTGTASGRLRSRPHARSAADLPIRYADRLLVYHRGRCAAETRAESHQRRFRGPGQRQAAADRLLSGRDTADHGHRDARHERQHDRFDSAVAHRRRTVCHPVAARRPGARRRVQRQDSDSAALHQQSRRARLAPEGPRLRERHPLVGRDGRKP